MVLAEPFFFSRSLREVRHRSGIPSPSRSGSETEAVSGSRSGVEADQPLASAASRGPERLRVPEEGDRPLQGARAATTTQSQQLRLHSDEASDVQVWVFFQPMRAGVVRCRKRGLRRRCSRSTRFRTKHPMPGITVWRWQRPAAGRRRHSRSNCACIRTRHPIVRYRETEWRR